MNSVRVVIVDDHPTFREGLKSVLDRTPGISVVAEYGSFAEGAEGCSGHPADVLITDISLPDGNGLDLINVVRKQSPDLGFLVLSVHNSSDFRREAFRCGAGGYLTKGSSTREIVEAIRLVAAGERIGDGGPAEGVFQAPDDAATRYARLSNREQEVFRLLAEGRSTKEIAVELSISAKTVETHRSKVMQKLHFDSIAQLARYAVGIGVVDPMPTEW